MTRLPIPGSDNGQWGELLNDFLKVEHNDDGSLKIQPIPAAQKGQPGGVAELDGGGLVVAGQLGGGAANSGTYLRGDGIWSAPPGAPVTSVAGKTGAVTLDTNDVSGLGTAATKDVAASGDATATQVVKGDDSRLTNARTPIDGSVTEVKLADDAVTTGKIAPSTILDIDISNSANISQNKIALAITDTEVAVGANIAQAKVANLTSDLAGKEPTITAGTTLQYWRGDKSWQTLDKSAVGLGNVDNTSDLSKPISTATQAALDLKANTSAIAGKVDDTGDTMNGSLNMSGASTQILFPDNASTSGGLSFGGDSTFARTNTGTLRFTAAAPILEFTSTNNTSGIRLNVTSAATTAYRLQYSGTSLITVNPSGATLISNNNTTLRTINGLIPQLQLEGTDAAGSTISATRNSADANPPGIYFVKSRGTANGSTTIVQSGDNLGQISFIGANGSNSNTFAALIRAEVDGTPAAADMPGRLAFYTTPAGTTTVTERMRIDNSGKVRIGSSATISSALTFDSATTAAGGILFGADTNLYRSAADSLKTDDRLRAAVGFFADTATTVALQGSQTAVTAFIANYLINGDTNAAFRIFGDGKHEWGAGGASATDTNLYRSAADVLKTDDMLRVEPTSNPSTLMLVTGTTTTSTANARGQQVSPIFSGSAAGPGGLAVQPEFKPSTDPTVVYGFINIAKSTPPTGVTIGTAYAGFNRIDTGTDSGVLTNAVAMYISAPSLGSIVPVNLYGVDVAAQTAGSSSNIGVRIAGASTYTLQLSSTAGTAASGITFGTDTNLYRSAADTLKTDDQFLSASYLSANNGTANQVYIGATASATPGAGILFGQGASADTNLYRSAADTLKTDDNLIVAAAGTAANSVANIDATQTLTNKRITKRISSNTSSSTPTPNADTTDVYLLTALAVGATFGAPTGTPTDGQSLIIRIKDNGTARSLAWNAIYRAVGTSLPTTTVISKTHYLGFIYNSADSKWDCLAVSQEA
ncbi:hypothetical protein EPO04_00725 [Patescibacteria group bacterium]|nr:MAG: hypothetical protein EPO04_00725 [Patescibacteria group bacterium]